MTEDDLFHLPEKDRDTILYTPLYSNHNNRGRPLLSRNRIGFKYQLERVKRFIHDFYIGRSIISTLSMRSSRKVIFVLFISISMYALISSETGEVTSLSNERNPYNGFIPTYETAITEIKPQSVPKYQKKDDENDKREESVQPSSIVILPDYFRNIADVSDVPVKKSDIPFYFHIPRSSGLTIKEVMENCVGLKGIGEDPSDQRGHRSNHTSKIEITHSTSSGDGSQFVNIETSTPQGLEHAKKLKLIEKKDAGFVVSQHLHSAATLFTARHRGRLFTIIRNPVERVISHFYDISTAGSESTNDTALPKMSIEMWAKSANQTEFNWMTRSLSSNLKGKLTPNDFEIAKEILRKKCLIGFLEAKSESVMRLQKYFNWEMNESAPRECFERYLDWGWSNKNSHPMVVTDSPTFKLLEKKNEYDMDLYEYGRKLFNIQSNLFENKNQEN